jgi:mannose-6-phosphate isomerase-like protein (cupin superfamily)
MGTFETKRLAEKADTLAPDGSEIRFLPQVRGGSMVHCRLAVGQVTQAVRHPRVEELWYVLAGQGEIWRKQGEAEEITPLEAGTALTLIRETTFQFRNTGETALEILIVTLPPWAGAQDAIVEQNYWERL